MTLRNDEMGARTVPVDDLLRAAGARPSPSIEATSRVRAAVHREYIEQVVIRRRVRQRWMAAAAALVALACGFLFTQRLRSASVVVAHVSRVVGESRTLSEGGAIRTGESLSVPAKVRLLLAHESGVELRLDENSKLDFVDAGKIRLDQGAVYIETPRVSHNGAETHLTVGSPYGEVDHVGTRFEVRVDPYGLRVRVRDGAAVFRSPAGVVTTVAAGEQLEYRSSAVRLSSGPLPSADDWRWAESAGPDFQIEGRKLLECLQWFAHEGGLQLEFADATARNRAASVVLHGRTGGLTPLEAMEVILSGTGMRYQVAGGRVRVGVL